MKDEMDGSPKDGSGDVVLPAWCEDIDYQRIFDCGCAMFRTAAHDKGVARANLKRLPLAGDPEMAMHYVNDLLMRMAVYRPGPAFHHLMLGKK